MCEHKFEIIDQNYICCVLCGVLDQERIEKQHDETLSKMLYNRKRFYTSRYKPANNSKYYKIYYYAKYINAIFNETDTNSIAYKNSMTRYKCYNGLLYDKKKYVNTVNLKNKLLCFIDENYTKFKKQKITAEQLILAILRKHMPYGFDDFHQFILSNNKRLTTKKIDLVQI